MCFCIFCGRQATEQTQWVQQQGQYWRKYIYISPAANMVISCSCPFKLEYTHDQMKWIKIRKSIQVKCAKRGDTVQFKMQSLFKVAMRTSNLYSLKKKR